MGLLSSKQVPLMGSPAHSLAEHLLTILSYKDGERDMNILHNIIDIEWPNNKKVLHKMDAKISCGDVYRRKELLHWLSMVNLMG